MHVSRVDGSMEECGGGFSCCSECRHVRSVRLNVRMPQRLSAEREEENKWWGGGVFVLGRIGVMLDEPNQILDRLGLNEQI